MNVFTPLNETRTERLKFDATGIEVLEDNGWDMRKRGYKATILIDGKTYKVYGISCGLPDCDCDAYIKEVV